MIKILTVIGARPQIIKAAERMLTALFNYQHYFWFERVCVRN